MNELVEQIKERILAQGKLTFADFMEMALYEPGPGYYTSSKQRVGMEGDFYTSPAIHPLFAALIAIQLEQMWQLLGCPANFTVVEMGAGKGLLARDILAYLPHLSEGFAQSVSYLATEREGVAVLKGTLPSMKPAQHTNYLPMQGITGCILSNELLDAFPTHKVIMRNGRLQEVYVTLDGDGFGEVAGDLSTPLLAEQFAQEDIILPEGYRTEINLNIGPWMVEVADSLEKGFVITIDYGYLAGELYAPERSQGTFMTYYKHASGSDPYVRIGEQDMTSHVDFTAAILAGEKKKLRLEALVSQHDFLLNLGFDIFLQALAGKGLSYLDHMANRFSMLELIREEGMGNFKVLIQSKGVAAALLYGIVPDNEGKEVLQANKEALDIPLLQEDHMPLLQIKYPYYADLPDPFDFLGHPEDPQSI